MTLDMEIEMMKRRVSEASAKKARQKTEKEINERVATDMIKDGKPLSEIIRYSKLTEAAIRKLAKSMGAAVL